LNATKHYNGDEEAGLALMKSSLFLKGMFNAIRQAKKKED